MKQLTCAKFVSYFNYEQQFEQGAGGPAEGACEPEIAYAAWIWPFSLASNPAGPHENRTPLTRIYSGRRRNKKRDKSMTSFQQMFTSRNNLFIYKGP
jgi:hypothetical protein